MDKFRIQGGVPLARPDRGQRLKKRRAPALAACLLTGEPVKLRRVPPVRDIGTMQQLLRHTGAELEVSDGDVTVRAKDLARPEAPYDLVKTMRASSLVLGPLRGSHRPRAGIDARRLRHRRASH